MVVDTRKDLAKAVVDHASKIEIRGTLASDMYTKFSKKKFPNVIGPLVVPMPLLLGPVLGLTKILEDYFLTAYEIESYKNGSLVVMLRK